MPPERALAVGEAFPGQDQSAHERARLLRPLLGISRDELQTLASRHGLQAGRDWCEDPSNVDQQFDRNYLRHSVVPLLQARWPQAVASLARSAQQLQEEQSLLDELAAELLAKVQVSGAKHLAQRQGQGQVQGLDQGLNQVREQETQLSLAELAGLSESRQRLVLRHLCQSRGWPVPPRGRLMSLQQLIATPPDSVAEVHWANAKYTLSVRAWRGQLWWQVSDTVIEQGVRHRQGDTGYARSGRQPGETPSCEWDSEARKAWRALGRGEEHVAFTSRQPGDVLRVAGRGRRDIAVCCRKPASRPGSVSSCEWRACTMGQSRGCGTPRGAGGYWPHSHRSEAGGRSRRYLAWGSLRNRPVSASCRRLSATRFPG